MYPPGTNGLCQVNPVIHEQRNPHVATDAGGLSGGDEKVAVEAALLSELDGVGSAPDGQFGQGSVRITLLEMKISEDVEPAEPSFARLCA